MENRSHRKTKIGLNFGKDTNILKFVDKIMLICIKQLLINISDSFL